VMAKPKDRTCPFPECKMHPFPGKSPHGFCIKHEEFVADLCFILPQIKYVTVKPAPAESPEEPGQAVEPPPPGASASP